MLEVADLEVRYGAIRAVRGISLAVGDGELVALLGANGAGKSSTLMCIAGALKAVGRQHPARRRGRDRRASPEAMVRRGVATVPETRNVFPDLTVAENLRLGAYIRRARPGRRRRGARRACSRCSRAWPNGRASRPARSPAASSRCW